eukprot:gb/GECG01000952.1/.p1 GENE.gb/GECG01000952.1/~~gb/GECG01000952.1/.p1  ORF type:complete len:176 (+),score=12.15 gb/GECG01000952.1/:1-528(+)
MQTPSRPSGSLPRNYVVSQMLTPSKASPRGLTYYQRRWVEKALVWVAQNKKGNLYRKEHVSSALLLCGIPPSTESIAQLYKLNYEKHGNRDYIDSDTFLLGLERLYRQPSTSAREMEQWFTNSMQASRKSAKGEILSFKDLEQVCLKMGNSVTHLGVQRNKVRTQRCYAPVHLSS